MTETIERYEPVQNGSAIQTVQPTHAGLAMSFQDMRQRVQLLDQFYKDVMQVGTDYDVIPGTPKPSLFQPGAQLLDAIFGLVPKFEELEGTIRDYDKGFFAYEIRCTLIKSDTGEVAAEGIGSCNSMEGRYRWRDAKPQCPKCGFDLRTSNRDPEWYCWKAKGGCGATYPLDQFKAGQKVENDDPYTLANTMLKMGQKRAHVAATLNATGASRIFTQDVEDMGDLGGSAREAQRPAAPQPTQSVRQQAPNERAAYAEGNATARRAAESLSEVIDAPQSDAPKASKPPRSRKEMDDVYRKLLTEAIEWNRDESHEPIEFRTHDPNWSEDEIRKYGRELATQIDRVRPKQAPVDAVPA